MDVEEGSIEFVGLETGEGTWIAIGTHITSYGADVTDIEVDKKTGLIVAKHMYGALDAGLR